MDDDILMSSDELEEAIELLNQQISEKCTDFEIKTESGCKMCPHYQRPMKNEGGKIECKSQDCGLNQVLRINGYCENCHPGYEIS